MSSRSWTLQMFFNFLYCSARHKNTLDLHSWLYQTSWDTKTSGPNTIRNLNFLLTIPYNVIPWRDGSYVPFFLWPRYFAKIHEFSFYRCLVRDSRVLPGSSVCRKPSKLINSDVSGPTSRVWAPYSLHDRTTAARSWEIPKIYGFHWLGQTQGPARDWANFRNFVTFRLLPRPRERFWGASGVYCL